MSGTIGIKDGLLAELTETTNKIETNLLVTDNIERREAIRACIHQIIIRAIALSKDPSVEIARLKDMYETALELSVLAGLEDEERTRLNDLVMQ